jgi:hypothetical protein
VLLSATSPLKELVIAAGLIPIVILGADVVAVIMPLLFMVTLPVKLLTAETDPAEATDDTVACLSAPDADESEIRMRSPAAGLALTVKAAIVENCGAALLEVKLPSSVHAAAFACLATVTALLAIVTAPPEVTVVISPLRV